MATTYRNRMWRILEADQPRGGLGHYVNLGLAALIVLNLIGITVETVPGMAKSLARLLFAIEIGSVAIFTVEYLARLWTCVEDPRYRRPGLGRLRYVLTPMALVDLVAVVPFYLPWMGVNLLTLRAFRLLRLLRLLKLGRYSEALQTLGRVIHKKRFELASTAVIAAFLLMVAAALVHAAEGSTQPEKFGTMPDCMWWAVVTMTTVGYGDVYPQTALGRLMGGIVAFLGIGLFALPTGILGAGFLEESNRKAGKRTVDTPTADRKCPHCGGAIGS